MEQEKFYINPLELKTPEQFTQLIKFCDQQIGQGYYKKEDLERISSHSIQDNFNSSLVVYHKSTGQIIAVRLTLAPGQWIYETKIHGFSTEFWKVDQNKVAYFKSLFIDPNFQKAGLGSLLSKKSIEVVKKMGGKGIVCHGTLGSPNNSSMRYLTKLGFEKIKEHPLFWNKIDYHCTHCLQNPCVCTAVEMFLHLD